MLRTIETTPKVKDLAVVEGNVYVVPTGVEMRDHRVDEEEDGEANTADEEGPREARKHWRS